MKKFLLLLTSLALLFSLCVTASASSEKILIWDEAQLLTADEVEELQNYAEQISDTYSMDVLIVTVETTGYESIEDFAVDFFLDNEYGYGEEQSGIIFLLAMDEREWTVQTIGEGENALSAGQISGLMEGIMAALANGRYYIAFTAYLQELEIIIKDYSEVSGGEITISVLVILGIGALAGLITILIMKRGMKTAVFQRGAQNYIKNGSFRVLASRDIFLYSHVTRVRRSNDSSSGRSSGRSGRF